MLSQALGFAQPARVEDFAIFLLVFFRELLEGFFKKSSCFASPPQKFYLDARINLMLLTYTMR